MPSRWMVVRALALRTVWFRAWKGAFGQSNGGGEGRRRLRPGGGRLLLTLLLSFAISLGAGSSAHAQGATQAQQLDADALGLARSGHFAQAESELRQANVLAPDNPRFLADLGVTLAMDGKLRDAAPYLDKALKLDPHNLALRCDLAAAELNLGEERQAERNLQYVLKARPSDREATLLLGMAAANLKQYRQALALFESVLGLATQQPQAVAALARCYYHTGQIAKARQLLLGLLKRREPPQAIFLGAQMAEEARDGPTAERLFESILSAYPDVPRVEYHLAYAKYECGQYAESESLLEQLVRRGHGTSETFNLLGRCYAKQGQMAHARKALETAINLVPSEEANYSDLATILLLNHELSAALVAAKWWASTFPASCRAHSMKADIEMKLHYYEQAATSYGQVLKHCPSSEPATLGLAKAEASAGLEAQAEATFQAGIRQFPKAEPLYRAYGESLLQMSAEGALDKKRRALVMLETAVRMDTSDWEARYFLGNLWLSESKARPALPELLTAARLSPKDSKIRFALWRAYSELGMTAQAHQQLEMFRHLRQATPGDKASTDAR
ncbi:MAG: tetratricopeptide repeat protein [Terriglobia bacterium]